MVDWQARGDAPATFSLGESLLALITGDPDWAWLGAWIPFMGEKLFITDDFCTAGPPPAVELDLLDFITGNRNPLGQLGDQAILAAKLGALAQARIFGAYCESPSEEGWTCVPWDEVNVTIPPGETMFRVTLTGAGTSGVPDQHVAYNVGGSWIEVHDSRGNFSAVGDERDFPVLAGATAVTFWDNSVGETKQYSWCHEGSFIPFEPTAPVEPPGLIAPATRVYDDIADLGEELDRQEFKLDTLISTVRALAISLVVAPDSPQSPVELVNGEAVAIVQAAGIVITLEGVPAGISEEFGVPVLFHKAGRLTFQTTNGFMTSIEITHSPFVVQPLPPGVTHIVTHVVPPIVATMSILPQIV